MAILNHVIAIPIWAAALAVVAIVVLVVVVRGLEAKRQIAAAVGIVALLAAFSTAVVSSQWATAIPHETVAAASSSAAERQALESRRAELAARAILPGSPLACLDALASEPVESTCERTVFASPASLAVAVSYAAARLRLLADGVAYARRSDPSYETSLADLRLAAQNDAFGIYAHVLATRDGCTPEHCPAFALLRDLSTLKLHLRQRLYTTYVAQHRDRWGPRPTAAAVAPVAPVATAPAAPAPAAVPEAPAAAAALAPPELAAAAAAPTPTPKARPKTTVAARVETSATAPAVAENVPAAPSTPAARPRGRIPPAASVVPNIAFPSSSSIPPISIMAAEPKLPPVAPAAPAAPAATPRPSARPQ